ncbi:MAG: calcium/sodium antiporter [Gammaproteobacteria bacterium]
MLTYAAATLAGFILLVWGADRFVLGAGGTARNLGVPPLLIGLTLVGMATSGPEIFVSVVAALGDEPELAMGNAIGSNIANIALVLGTTALVMPIVIRSATLRREMPALLAVTLLLVMVFLNRTITRPEGLLLLMGLVVLMYWLIVLSSRFDPADPITAEIEAEIPANIPMVSSVAWLVVGLVVLLAGSNLLVWGAHNVAEAMGVSDLVIGLTLVAVGTSFPELAVSIVSALKQEHDLALGNIIGSNMFNSLAVVGLAAAIRPATLEPELLTLHLPVMIGVTLMLFAIAYNLSGKSRIGRLEGAVLLASFFAYHGYLALR